MKLAVKFVIFIFLIFLSTPTIVSLIEKNTDTSIFYSMTEEEIFQKEVNSEFLVDMNHLEFSFFLINKIQIQSENAFFHDSISSKIFIPPPDFT